MNAFLGGACLHCNSWYACKCSLHSRFSCSYAYLHIAGVLSCTPAGRQINTGHTWVISDADQTCITNTGMWSDLIDAITQTRACPAHTMLPLHAVLPVHAIVILVHVILGAHKGLLRPWHEHTHNAACCIPAMPPSHVFLVQWTMFMAANDTPLIAAACLVM